MAALLTGCALDFSQVTRGEALVDAGVDAGVDGGADTSPAESGQVGATHEANDAEVAPDAGSTAAPFDVPFFHEREPLDATTFSCASSGVALFCDDFESVALKDHWTNPVQLPGSEAHLSIDSREPAGGHGALLAELSDGPVADNYLGAYAAQGFDSFKEQNIRVTVDLDLRVELIDPKPGRYVAVFAFNFGNPLWERNELLVRIESEGTSVRAHLVERDITKPTGLPGPDVETLFNHPLAPTPRLNEWTHLRFELDAVNASGSGNSARVTLGETVLFEGLLEYRLRGEGPRMAVGLPWPSTLKLTADDPSHAWRVRYDNVLVRIVPR